MLLVVRIMAAFLLSQLACAHAAELSQALQTLNSVGNAGQGHAEAMLAWRTAGAAEAESLPVLLKAVDDEKPIAANWIRAAIDQVAERSLDNGRSLPTKKLEAIVSDESYSPRSQRLAYEWLLRTDTTAKQRIVPMMLNSASLEMRRDAVELMLARAVPQASRDQQIETLREALTAARDIDQIDEAFKKLNDLDVPVDLPRHFGFVMRWRVIGPFDNTNKAGFDIVYPPEKNIALDASYDGKTGKVQWRSHMSTDKYGMIDLNKALGKNMGAAGYAYAEFETDREMDVDLRLGCVCAAKVWLNGDLRMSHEVYHSGTKIDQYVAQGHLAKGKNSILLKVCQNEQTENWAQDWQFQFRVCDRLGTAVLAKGRKRQ